MCNSMLHWVEVCTQLWKVHWGHVLFYKNYKNKSLATNCSGPDPDPKKINKMQLLQFKYYVVISGCIKIIPPFATNSLLSSSQGARGKIQGKEAFYCFLSVILVCLSYNHSEHFSRNNFKKWATKSLCKNSVPITLNYLSIVSIGTVFISSPFCNLGKLMHSCSLLFVIILLCQDHSIAVYLISFLGINQICVSVLYYCVGRWVSMQSDPGGSFIPWLSA